MRRAALLWLVPLLGVTWALPARTSEDPEDAAPAAAPAALPPIRVRLATVGTPAQLTISAPGPIALTNPLASDGTETSLTSVTVSAAGEEVQVGERKLPALRVAADLLTVAVGRGTRTYPNALVVTARGGRLTVVNECSLESYAEGVLAGECPARFHPEAIRAMAVAARTYSYRKAFLSGEDLCDTTNSQVYLGVGNIPKSLREAVQATRGLIAMYQGQVIDAVYSSDCGGYTEANEEAWKGALPLSYLRPVEDAPTPNGEPFCSINRGHRWKLALPSGRLRALLGKPTTGVRLDIAELTPSGRARQVLLVPAGLEAEDAAAEKAAGKTFAGPMWRQVLGPTALKSLKFSIRETPAGVELEGTGWGHGVGLCQWGAHGMGKAGHDFRAILGHYYTGIEIAPAPTGAALIARARPRSLASRKGRPASRKPTRPRQ